MRYLKTLVFVSLFLSACNGNPKTVDTINVDSINSYSKSIKAQGEAMVQLLLKKDYASFAKSTYPAIVEMMGGKEKMIETLGNSINEMESNGTSLLNVTIGEPSKIITAGNELQCTIPQTIEMKTPKGRAVEISTLIAISTDNGKNWYFVDTSGKDIQTMKKTLPNLSGDLIIPAKQKPTFYDN